MRWKSKGKERKSRQEGKETTFLLKDKYLSLPAASVRNGKEEKNHHFVFP